MKIIQLKKHTKKILLCCVIIVIPLFCIITTRVKETARRNAQLKALEEMEQRQIELNKWFEENKDGIYEKKLLLKNEAEIYVEELKNLIIDNSVLLDSFNEVAFSLPYEAIRIVPKDDGYSSQPPIEDLVKISPDFLKLLDQLHEEGLVWKEVNIWPKTSSTSFVILRKAEGGMCLYLSIDSPLIHLSSYEFEETIEITEEWGIHWNIDSMDGI